MSVCHCRGRNDPGRAVSHSEIAGWAAALQVQLGSASIGNRCRAILDLSVQKDVETGTNVPVHLVSQAEQTGA